VTWLVLTGAGLVVETVVIVVLGRTVTARDDPGDEPSSRPDRMVRGNGRGGLVGLLDHDLAAFAERMEAGRETNS